MRVLDVIQGSEAWLQARIGLPTSSNFDKIITATGKPSAQRQKYLYQLAGERVTGKTEETYVNQAMQRGKDLEAEARTLYEMTQGVEVKQVGFCLSDDGQYGCSPDGLVGEEGGLEIKCPMIYTHVGYILEGKLPTDYIQQVQGNLLVTGRKWWDFCSYFPGMKPLIVRVEPDVKYLELLKTELDKFCKELNELVEKIK